MDLPSSEQPHRNQSVLELLTALSYRSRDLSSYLKEIAFGTSSLIGADWSVVTLCQNGAGRVLASSLELGESDNGFLLHGSLSGIVVHTGQPLVIEDIQLRPEYSTPPTGYQSYLGVPLCTTQGEVIGTICSFNQQPRPYTKEEISTVKLLAERAATAIDNYQLYHRQQEFNESLEREVAARTQELQTAQTKLIERERLAAIGEFAAMIVHEVRNPMTTILLGLQYFQKTATTASAQERGALAIREAYRLERLLTEILLYAKPQALQLSKLELNPLMRELLEFVRQMPEAAERQIELSTNPSGIKILGERDKLKQVMLNLTRNACEAVEPGNVIRWQIDCLSSEWVCIRVNNGGVPIPAEVLPKLTQPFYSTKPMGNGLGLAIVRRIIEAHAGELSIQSDAVSGTTVTIKLPVANLSN